MQNQHQKELKKDRETKHPMGKKAGVVVLAALVSLGAAGSYLYFNTIQHPQPKLEETTDIYVNFTLEVYDKIQKNFWDKLTDEKLSDLYRLGAEKLTGDSQTLILRDKTGLKSMLIEITKTMNAQQKKEFSVNLANIVLNNLNPFGRSKLYTTRQQVELKNKVQNINPEKDLYKDIGLEKGASEEAVKKAYEEKAEKLEQEKEKSEEAKKKLEDLNYAFNVLSDDDSKKNYDEKGVEPTVFSKLIREDIAYISIKKLSPQTFEEFTKEANKIEDREGLNSLILDMRGNIGGTTDVLPFFLGPFIGPNQYAFEFHHQGVNEPFKTKTSWLPSLVKYKKVVILVDGNTQSSAEIMAATLKKYNVGVVVGTKTKGWGTIEKVFPIEQQLDLNETYSMFLVHSLSLRGDGQPIEGRGVEPTINIDNPNWEKELLDYFNYQELVEAVKQLWEKGE